MPKVYHPLPPPEILWEMLEYEPLTGLLRWRVTAQKGSNRIGTIAGFRNAKSGYIYIKNSRWDRTISIQRVVWKWITGEDPGQMIVDHANLNKQDNRWWNLRLATASQSSRNRPQFAFCTHQPKGITRRGSQWRARIWIDGKRTHLGYFATEEDAHAAYCVASAQYHGDYGRTA
jgi:hypothetical protein